MSYGMHDYLVEKTLQNYGMRKEAGIGSVLSTAGKGIATGAKWLGDKLAKYGGRAVWNQGDSLAAKLSGGKLDDFGRAIVRKSDYAANGVAERLGKWLWDNPKKTRAAILGLEGAGAAGVGAGAYAGGKALLGEDSYLDKALDLINQYKGTAIGIGSALPVAGIAAMASKKNKLRNALLTGAITALLAGGAGLAYDRYNA